MPESTTRTVGNASTLWARQTSTAWRFSARSISRRAWWSASISAPCTPAAVRLYAECDGNAPSKWSDFGSAPSQSASKSSTVSPRPTASISLRTFTSVERAREEYGQRFEPYSTTATVHFFTVDS